jgi:hypothetical protein
MMPSPLPDHTPNSSLSLAIMLSLFFISDHYAETIRHQWSFLRFFACFWQCDPSSSLLQLSLSSLLQLQTSTLSHLSIVSMMSLHSTGSYLETLRLLWQSPYCSSNSLADAITSFWQLLRKPLRVHPFGTFSLPEKNFTVGASSSC